MRVNDSNLSRSFDLSTGSQSSFSMSVTRREPADHTIKSWLRCVAHRQRMTLDMVVDESTLGYFDCHVQSRDPPLNSFLPALGPLLCRRDARKNLRARDCVLVSHDTHSQPPNRPTPLLIHLPFCTLFPSALDCPWASALSDAPCARRQRNNPSTHQSNHNPREKIQLATRGNSADLYSQNPPSAQHTPILRRRFQTPDYRHVDG
jgi:hypothetical protein